MISAIAVPALFFSFFGFSDLKPVGLQITTTTDTISYTVEIADSPFTQLKGLMNRETLQANNGMLFSYTNDRHPKIWMKNVRFPLDILFVDNCGVIVELHANAKPNDTTVISSSVPVRAVLEILGGASKRAQIHSGDTLSIAGDADVFDECSTQ